MLLGNRNGDTTVWTTHLRLLQKSAKNERLLIDGCAAKYMRVANTSEIGQFHVPTFRSVDFRRFVCRRIAAMFFSLSDISVLHCELLQNMVEDLDKAAILIAAAVHDLDHMGRTSAFLVNVEHPLALLYNDKSVHRNFSSHCHVFVFWCANCHSPPFLSKLKILLCWFSHYSQFLVFELEPELTKWRRNIVENFNRLSRVHERYRQTTDGRTDDDI